MALKRIALRDFVIVRELELDLSAGFSVLTGETGAGKSILLDSLGLALGQRAESGLVRAGQPQASVAAVFQPPAGHPAHAILTEQGMEDEEVIVLRRVLQADGRSRAFVNDQPVGVALLKRLAASLVAPGGYLGLCSCSHAADLAAFRNASARGIGRGGRRMQLIHTGFAGPDHPMLPQLAESGYLKALFFRLDG